MDFLTENWHWLTTVLVPLAAPVITTLVNKFGSEGAKSRWSKIRRIYRAGIGMKK